MFDQRFFKITLAVLLFHAGLLYLIQSGLGRKITEAVISPEIVARIIPLEPPQKPAVETPKPKPETPPKQVKVTTPKPTP
ncbi:energy transducer TonB, partial [Cupriavidus basilensis]|nr:energy transducer TonB [Cupriavidus basilensis]